MDPGEVSISIIRYTGSTSAKDIFDKIAEAGMGYFLLSDAGCYLLEWEGIKKLVRYYHATGYG